MGWARNLSEARRRLQARALGILGQAPLRSLGSLTTWLLLLDVLLVLIPATRPLGAVLYLAAIGPAALLAHRSIRRGRPGDARQVGIADLSTSGDPPTLERARVEP